MRAVEPSGLERPRRTRQRARRGELALGCGQVVRLDRDRHQRRNQVKLSLLDLPFLPDELRELAPPGALPGSPRALEP